MEITTKMISDIYNDPTLNANDKRIYLNIYNGELERQSSNKMIKQKKAEIDALRKKIMSALGSKMDKYYENEEKYEAATRVLFNVGTVYIPSDFKEGVDFVSEDIIDSPSMTGTIENYLDNDIHKDIVALKQLSDEFCALFTKKYTKLKEKFADLIGEETFNYYNADGTEVKSKEELSATIIKADKKIAELDISSKEKGILRDIKNDVIEYGKSCERPYANGTYFSSIDYSEQTDDKKMNF